MFKDMETSVMGVWVSHAEGRFTYQNQQIFEAIRDNNCIALRYVDDDNNWTQE